MGPCAELTCDNTTSITTSIPRSPLQPLYNKMSDMATRIASMRSVLPELRSALNAFTASSANFRVVRSINPTNSSPSPPKSLYILDSSFNPPSIAHLALATAAVTSPSPTDPKPHRLLLLFSTHNADKSPGPASFEHRLAMIILFAEDLHKNLTRTSALASQPDSPSSPADVAIDIGLTKAPYYTDKTITITSADPLPYPSNPIHVHLIGYDTVTRFLAPKYYTNHNPPLSALAPYFDSGHKIFVTLRPSNPDDQSSLEFGSLNDQKGYIEGLEKGSLEKEGFKPGWAKQVDTMTVQESVGVSSTRIRNAAKRGDWEELKELCTPGVTAWVKEMELYKDDAKGAKMA